MPRAEGARATGPRDATMLGIAVRCGGVGCWWLVGARRPPPPPHGGRASIERGGRWASEATAAASEAEHTSSRLWAKARTQQQQGRGVEAVDTRSSERREENRAQLIN